MLVQSGNTQELHLHDAIPVVASGNSKEQQERHPKVSESGVAAQTLTRMELITDCGQRESEKRQDSRTQGFFFAVK